MPVPMPVDPYQEAYGVPRGLSRALPASAPVVDPYQEAFLPREGEFVRGLRRGASGMASGTKAGLATLAQPFAPQFADQVIRDALASEQQAEETNAPAQRTLRNAMSNGLGGVADYAAGKVGEFVPAIPLGMVGGAAGKFLSRSALAPAVGGAAVFQPSMAGSEAMRLLTDPAAAGMTPTQRAIYANTVGAAEAAAGGVVPGMMGGRLLTPKPGNVLGNAVRGVVGNSLGMGAGMGAMDVIGQKAQTVYNPNARFDPAQTEEAIAGGAIGGIPFAGAHALGVAGADIAAKSASTGTDLASRAASAGADLAAETTPKVSELARQAWDARPKSLDEAALMIGKGAADLHKRGEDALDAMLNPNQDIDYLLTPQTKGTDLQADDVVRNAKAQLLSERILQDDNAPPALKEAAESFMAGPKELDAWKTVAQGVDSAKYDEKYGELGAKLKISLGKALDSADKFKEDVANVYNVEMAGGLPKKNAQPVDIFNTILAKQLFDTKDYRYSSHPLAFYNIASALRDWIQGGFRGSDGNLTAPPELGRIFKDPVAAVKSAYDLMKQQGLVTDEKQGAHLLDMLDVVKSRTQLQNADVELVKKSLTPVARMKYAGHEAELADLLKDHLHRLDDAKLDELFGPQKEAVLEQLRREPQELAHARDEKTGPRLSDEEADAHEQNGGAYEELAGMTDPHNPSIVESRVQHHFYNPSTDAPYARGNDAHDEHMLKKAKSLEGNNSRVTTQGYLDALREKHRDDPAAYAAALESAKEKGYTNEDHYVLREEHPTDKRDLIDIPGSEFSALTPDAKGNRWGETTGIKHAGGTPRHGKLFFERVDADGKTTQFATSTSKIIKRMRESMSTDQPGLAGQHDMLMAGISSLLNSKHENGRLALSGRIGFLDHGRVQWLDAHDRLPDNLRLHAKGSSLGEARAMKAEQHVNRLKDDLRNYKGTDESIRAQVAAALKSGKVKELQDAANRIEAVREGASRTEKPKETAGRIGTRIENVLDENGNRTGAFTEKGGGHHGISESEEMAAAAQKSAENKPRGEDPGNELANRGAPKLEASADPKQAAFLLDTLRKGMPAFNDMLKRATPEQKAGMKTVLEKMLKAQNNKDPMWGDNPPKDMIAFGKRARRALLQIDPKWKQGELDLGDEKASPQPEDSQLPRELPAKPSTTMPMKFTDGTVYNGITHTMRPEFKGKSTLDLIRSGDRTATTRMGKPDAKPGDIIKMDDGRGGTVDVRVTRDPYQLKWFGDQRDAVNAEKWSKLEGWSPSVYEAYAKKGAWQMQYEQAGTKKNAQQVPIGLKVSERLHSWAKAISEGRAKTPVATITEAPKGVLNLAGVYRPITMDLEHVRHTLNVHPEITAKDIAALPDLLMHPRAVMKYKDGLRFIVDARDADGHPLMVALNPTAIKSGPKTYKITEVSTMMGWANSATRIAAALLNGDMIYMPQKEIARLRGLMSVEQISTNADKTGTTAQRSGRVVNILSDEALNKFTTDQKSDWKTTHASIELSDKAIDTLRGVDFNRQRPSLDSEKRATPEEIKAANDYIDKTLGPKMKRAFIDDLGGHSADWTPDAQGNVIRIATNAVGGVYTNAVHESMHEFFNRLVNGKQDAVKDLLTRVTSNQIVTRSLERILDGHPEALAAMKADPEERLAYAYQFWEAGHPLMKLGPKAESFFERVAAFFRKITGLLRDDEKVEAIFRQFNEGKLQDPSVAGEVIAKLNNSERRVQAVANTVEPFRKVAIDWVGSAEDNLLKSTNPILRKIGESFADHTDGYIQAHDRAEKQWMGKLKQALRPFEKDDIAAALEGLQTGKLSSDKTIRAVQDNVRDLLEEMHSYLEKAGVSVMDEETGQWKPIGKLENYFPRSWSTDELYKRGPEFIERLLAEHLPELESIAAKANLEVKEGIMAGRGTASQIMLGKKPSDRTTITAQDVADAIYARLMNSNGQHEVGNGLYSLGFSPMMKAVNRRTLNWIDMSKFHDFQNKDIVNIMSSYVMQATKRAEYTRRFGPDGGKLSEQMDKARYHEIDKIVKAEYGIDDASSKAVSAMRAIKSLNGPKTTFEEQLANIVNFHGKDAALSVDGARDIVDRGVQQLIPAQRAVLAMEGTLGHDISPTLRKAQGWVLAYQNWRMLPMALFSNLIDPLGILVRGGTMDDTFKAYKTTLSDVVNSWRGKERDDNLTQMHELIGTLDAQGYLSSIGSMMNSMYMGGGAKRMNDALFRINGMEAMNRSMRSSATQAAIGFIKRHAEMPNEHSERLLGELKLDADYVKSKIGKGPTEAMGLDVTDPRIQNAISQWVNEAILRPTSAQRPSRMSDPHWALFSHFKGFMYSMHKQILTRAAREARYGNYTAASTLALGYIPIMFAADLAKIITQNAIAGNAKLPVWWENMDAKDHVEYAAERAGLLGPAQILRDAFEYGPSAVGGPTAEQFTGLFTDPIGKSAMSALPWNQFFASAQRAVND